LERLDLTAVYAGDRKKDVYVGNDIYGRGTWGGGKYNTFKAINEIKQRGLSYALFGTAYFYESNTGFVSPALHALNEE
jgi:mannosyl-glycoprotein endo-beta-N-acetylglucosaminidase